MIARLSDPSWSEAQKAFVLALEAAGATKPEHAVPIDRAPAIPVRELQALVDSGVVREGSSNGYYLYSRQVRRELSLIEPIGMADLMLGRGPIKHRLLKSVIFWILMILIPIVLIQLTGTR